MTKVKGMYGSDILDSNHRINYLIKYEANRYSDRMPEKDLKDNLEEIADDINRIQDDFLEMKKILCLGVNIKDYLNFKEIIPHVNMYKDNISGKRKFYHRDLMYLENRKYIIEQVQFCYNFVLELAINN
jgi:hypothetical protein